MGRASNGVPGESHFPGRAGAEIPWHTGSWLDVQPAPDIVSETLRLRLGTARRGVKILQRPACGLRDQASGMGVYLIIYLTEADYGKKIRAPRLSPPKVVTFWIAVLLAVIGVIAKMAPIASLAEYAFGSLLRASFAPWHWATSWRACNDLREFAAPTVPVGPAGRSGLQLPSAVRGGQER